MDEAHSGDEPCRVIYFCPVASNQQDIETQQFHRSRPHDLTHQTPSSPQHDALLKRVYRNITILLDEDQGNIEQVYLSSSREKCLDELENQANRVSTLVLIESGASPDEEASQQAMPFLRRVHADVTGARFQQQVMPFVLVESSTFPDSMHFLDPTATSTYLEAGAIDMVRSPFTPIGLNRVIGHAKERTRPSAHILGAAMARNLVDSIRNHSTPRVTSHRPDQFLSEKQKSIVEAAVGKWHFSAHQFDMDELTYGVLFMLEHILQDPILEEVRLPRPQLMSFLLSTRRQYKHDREVYYHNWRHAVDVTQSLYCFLCQLRICPPADPGSPPEKEPTVVEKLLTPLDGLVLLIAAIGHDVGHPGVNNAFLVACNHPLAHLYNDKSVLENYHCAAYSQLLRRHWQGVNQIPNFRSTMISTILATDMQRHFEYMGQLNDLKQKVNGYDGNGEEWSEKDREHVRELAMALLIKAADISNVARPFEISAQWARILMNEFFRQGELESELEIPTCLFGGPPDKTDMLAAAQSQKGFMTLFGFPLFRGISEVMPNVSCTLKDLEKNQEIWEQKIMEEKQKAESRPNTSPGSGGDSTADDASVHSRPAGAASAPVGSPRSQTSPAKKHVGVDHKVSSSRHAAHDSKHHFSTGSLHFDDSSTHSKRASAPLLMSGAMALSPMSSGQSRRSSKDVALTQLQELGGWSQSMPPQSDSRRGSVDAAWQLHQSYPGSRRGSKDESLTTILVTSQANPGRSATGSPSLLPAMPSLTEMPSRSPEDTKDDAKDDDASPRGGREAASNVDEKESVSASGQTRAPGPARVPPTTSRSHATSSATNATATSNPQSPMTDPSSIADDSFTASPPQNHHSSIAATEDPFIEPGTWPNNFDGRHRVSAPALMDGPHVPQGYSKTSTPNITRHASKDSTDDAPSERSRKESRGLKESRSRSRLRGLKFWKKRRDVSGDKEPVPSETATSP